MNSFWGRCSGHPGVLVPCFAFTWVACLRPEPRPSLIISGSCLSRSPVWQWLFPHGKFPKIKIFVNILRIGEPAGFNTGRRGRCSISPFWGSQILVEGGCGGWGSQSLTSNLTRMGTTHQSLVGVADQIGGDIIGFGERGSYLSPLFCTPLTLC